MADLCVTTAKAMAVVALGCQGLSDGRLLECFGGDSCTPGEPDPFRFDAVVGGPRERGPLRGVRAGGAGPGLPADEFPAVVVPMQNSHHIMLYSAICSTQLLPARAGWSCWWATRRRSRWRWGMTGCGGGIRRWREDWDGMPAHRTQGRLSESLASEEMSGD